MMLHKIRLMLTRQVVMISNATRAHMAEFGVIAPVGRSGIDRLLAVIDDETDERIPVEARQCLQMLVAQLRLVKSQILDNDRRVLALARSTELGQRLMEVPGIGPLVASALVACVPDPSMFRCGRNMAAWLGPPKAELFRRERAIRINHKGRQPLSPPNALRRCHGGHTPSNAGHAPHMAHPIARTAEAEDCGDGAGEQERQDRMGNDDEWRGVSRADCHSSMTRSRS